MRRLRPIDPAAYSRHPLHRDERTWPESNCYVDLWIELLHAWGLDPLAALSCTLTVDIEGDQWTFFKVPVADLYTLYGVEVIELNVWRSLIDHIEAQLALGRPSIVEVDAYYLPDTAGTSYHTEHVKTSIAVQALDRPAHRVGYFHNLGYYELGGPDFAGVFRLDDDPAGHRCLPPYVEVAKFGVRPPQAGRALVRTSLELLAGHLARRPQDNPFRRYGTHVRGDLESLAGPSLAPFHRYAFATFRQCGAAFELTSAYLRWLQRHGQSGLDPIAADCDLIASTAKTLQFTAARSVNSSRSVEFTSLVDTMAVAWDKTMMGLADRYGALAHQE